MPKNLRLSQADFALLRRIKSHKTYGTHFVMTAYPLPPALSGPRVASVIAKKIVRGAVRRNAVERKFREIVRAHKNLLDERVAYIFTVKKGVTEASYKELETDIEALLRR